MVILLKGAFDTLDYFIDEMAKGTEAEVINLKEAQKSVDRLLEIEKELDESTVVVTFNGLGANLRLGGVPFWQYKKVRFFNILVDHPVFSVSDILRDFYYGYHVVCIDEGHREFLSRILPEPQKSVLFIPHGGVELEEDDERTIDALYIGSFFEEDEINFPAIDGIDSELFYEKIIEFYSNNEYVEVQDAVDYYAKEMGTVLDPEILITLTYHAVCTVDQFFTGRRRETLVESLALSGVKVQVYGKECWKRLADKYPQSVIYGGLVKPEECISLIGKTKVLLNDLPYFSKGSHERIYNGMLNGAVVVSNKSKYLEERFCDGEDILFWDGNNPEDICEKIKNILSNEEKREAMAENAYAKVKSDLWKNRFLEILSFKD